MAYNFMQPSGERSMTTVKEIISVRQNIMANRSSSNQVIAADGYPCSKLCWT